MLNLISLLRAEVDELVDEYEAGTLDAGDFIEGGADLLFGIVKAAPLPPAVAGAVLIAETQQDAIVAGISDAVVRDAEELRAAAERKRAAAAVALSKAEAITNDAPDRVRKIAKLVNRYEKLLAKAAELEAKAADRPVAV